jgi:hypothetical protein
MQEKLNDQEAEEADENAESQGRPAPSDIQHNFIPKEAKKKSSGKSVVLPPQSEMQRKIMDAAVGGDEEVSGKFVMQRKILDEVVGGNKLVDVVEKIENGGVKKNLRHGVTNWKNELHEDILNRMAAEDRSHNSMLSKTDSFWKSIADTSPQVNCRNGKIIKNMEIRILSTKSI